MTSARRNDFLLGAVALLVIVLDQLTKHWIVAYFTTGAPKQPIRIFGRFLDLEYLKNSGAAFSLFTGQWELFVFIAIALIVVGVLYWRTRGVGSPLLKVAFGLVAGGAIGNLIDRFSHQYVVDFIHFQIPGAPGQGPIFDWPVFNVADSAICVGVVLIAFLIWRGSTEPKSGLPAETSVATPDAEKVTSDAE